jgi:periplasmic protein TonB
MLISKFDLYKTEWLELVFDNRNKAYGAYELRQHNSRTMLTAMGIAIVGISVPLIIIGALFKPVAVPIPLLIRVIPVNNFVIEHPAIAQPHQPRTHVSPPPVSTAPITMRIPVPVAIVPPATIQPTTHADLDPGVITGPTSTTINGGTVPGGGSGTSGATDNPGNEPVSTVGLQRMPEPYGGAGAWGKFLGKNLKYPEMAVDQHMQGKVWVSFIVEKDGRLSNIVVDRGAGYGMDEEALRVLKMSPAWKPGIQNGQPVRVRFNIPINFQLSDDNN